MTRLSDDAMRRLRDVARGGVAPDERYEIGEVIGEGGMGVVHRARDRALDRDVAWKVLGPHAHGASALRRMEREARILARLEHPGIVPIHDVGTLPDGRVWYAMKLVRGDRLDDYARGLEGLGERLRLFARLCEPIAFAHARGIVHRDLKPANVMVGAFGEVLVMDWGVAKVIGAAVEEDDDDSSHGDGDGDDAARRVAGSRPESATQPGSVLGTPGYMAPEQERGDVLAVDARADVRALGTMLAELIADHAPDRRLRAIRDKARAERPEDRYPDAGALAQDILRYQDGQPVAAHPESALERAARFVHRHRTPFLLVAAYVVVRALILWWGGQ